MSLSKFFVTAGTVFALLVFFQNCQRAKMESKGTADNSSLARVNEASLDLPPAPGPIPTATPDPNPTPNPTPSPTPVCPTDDGDHNSNSDDGSDDHSHHAHHKSNYGHDMCDDNSSDDRSSDDCKDPKGNESGDREYICDIHKPGNDHAIGITENESLEVKHQGVKMVCMSKYACETVAAKAFPGAKAEARGFCKADSNKNVKHVSDARMIELVDKYILANPATP